MYRGDSLKGLGSVKDIRSHILQYFKNNIVKWKTRKVELLVRKLPQNTVADLNKGSRCFTRTTRSIDVNE